MATSLKGEFTATPLAHNSKSQSDVDNQKRSCANFRMIGSQTIPPN